MSNESLNWAERFVPTVDTSIALFTMNVKQKNAVFSWVDTGILDGRNKEPIYSLMRTVWVPHNSKGVFAAFTCEEFQTFMPLNFTVIQSRPGIWCTVDLYGTTLQDQVDNNARQIILSRVNGSEAGTGPESFGKALIFLIQTGAIKLG